MSSLTIQIPVLARVEQLGNPTAHLLLPQSSVCAALVC